MIGISKSIHAIKGGEGMREGTDGSSEITGRCQQPG